MKKKKTYEISVIDKTYSKIISDETKFYTSDTALELGFELKETDYTFKSAEIVLLNIDDRSLVTRPVAKVLDGFTYELEDDITAHYGEWRGQLRFEQAGEIYVSSPVKFRIENDLGNERPPQLSDVQSWVSLKRYADGLVDELKQAVEEAVANVEAMDDTFKANELDRDKAEKERQATFEKAETEREKGENIRVETFQTNEANRQNQFETAEQSRQTTFETNESERAETFNTNEDIRQQQELEREKAESQRQTVFDGNEANRTETFNANEATRQENETARQQAESQRQSTFETNESERQTTFEIAENDRVSAESSRVSAEEQRKIDHANRSAELAGKADKVVLKNIIKNGDFSDGLDGWNDFGKGTLEVVENELKVTSDADVDYSWVRHMFYGKFYNVYYATAKARTYSSQNEVTLENYNGDEEVIPLDGKASVRAETNGVNNSVQFIIRQRHSPHEPGAMLIDYMMAFDLTAIFGAGNEPTKEEMDELINITGYIDGEYALNNKEMLIWTLALIRRNKNAIITLGGTI